MKRIVVTGGAGRLGSFAIAELLQRGYDVLCIDCVRPDTITCPFLHVDLTDSGSVSSVLRDADAVLHLGAIPGPQSHAPAHTFHNNVVSTYNVAEASAVFGLEKLVFASSVFALGWHSDADRYWPQYLPVDEAHPLTPLEAYGLSKKVGEEICATASRQSGSPSVSLRIMNVIQADAFTSLPWPVPTNDRKVRFVLWPYVDVRDAARACRMAIEADISGHEAIYIAARDIRFDCETRELLKMFGPEGLEIRGPLDGCASVICIDKASHMIGFEPQYSWQDTARDFK